MTETARSSSGALRGAVFVGITVLLGPYIAFFGTFLFPDIEPFRTAGMLLYDTIFSILPLLCRAGMELQQCLGHWEWHPVPVFGVWAAAALLFGWGTRKEPWHRQLLGALILVLVVATLARLLLPLAGYTVLIDTI